MKDYRIVISQRVIDPYDAEGEWMEGDARTIQVRLDTVLTYDEDDADEYSHPAAWAVSKLRETDATEASSFPITGHEHEWLSGTYNDPYTTHITETTARLVGAWTVAERQEVFRQASADNRS